MLALKDECVQKDCQCLYQCSTRVDRSTMSLLAWLWLWLRLGFRSSKLIKVLQRREVVPRVACDPWINGLVAVNHVEAWVVWDEAPSLVIKIQVSDLRVGVCQCFWFLSPRHPRLYIRLQTDNRTNALFICFQCVIDSEYSLIFKL